MAPEDIQKNHDFSTSPGNSSTCSPSQIKVVGVGGGGNNAVNHMYNLGVRSVSFIVANTDRQALIKSPVPNKLLLGPHVLGGRGAGNDPEKARLAAEESTQEINELFDDDTDMVFVTAGMGGGTGTGASPTIANIARQRGILTIGIVTIPFLFEGRKKILKALEGAKELSKNVDALLVINNERLSEIYHDLDMLNAMGKADDILSMAAMSISEIVTVEGYINLDFNDVDKTLRDGGTAIISTGYGEGENRVTKAIEDAIHSPLLRNTDIFSSKRLLFNLYFSPKACDTFKIDETNQITDFISNIDSEVDVIWGLSFDESLGDKVKITILASGFDITIIDDNTVIKAEPLDKSQDTVSATYDEDTAHNALVEHYGADKIDSIARAKDGQRYIILQPDQLEDDNVLGALEQNPAFNRDRSIVSSVKNGNNPASSAKEPLDPGTIDFSDLD